jgi:hypothetical protein
MIDYNFQGVKIILIRKIRKKGLDLARLEQKPPYLCGVFIDDD